ncbi:unknown [Clostridium sp. CAG:149]|nr:unknown [Clostridium sp. CAG:149]
MIVNLKVEDIIRILENHKIAISEEEIERIPERGINPAERIHLDAIRY